MVFSNKKYFFGIQKNETYEPLRPLVSSIGQEKVLWDRIVESMIAFLFPGQGSQQVGMGRPLFANFQEAREVLQEVESVLGRFLGPVFLQGPEEDLCQTENLQLAIFTVSMAVLKVLECHFGFPWRKHVSYVAGHSLGEYTALCASQALTLDQAVLLLKHRSQAMARCARSSKAAGGGMGAVLKCPLDALEAIVQDPLVVRKGFCMIANDNSPEQVVLSGHKIAIEQAFTMVQERYPLSRCVMLDVSGPFHSPLMEGALEELQEVLCQITFQKPKIPIVSNITAQAIECPEILRKGLSYQLVRPVRWRETMEFLSQNGVNQFAEIGPGKVLCGLVRKNQGLGVKSRSYGLLNPTDMESFIDEFGPIGTNDLGSVSVVRNNPS
jgi:[acyl-carrier-protein] S-malonyltransferase